MRVIKYILLMIMVLVPLLVNSCEDYVQNFQSREDLINDDQLNDVNQVNFLITGVQANLSDMVDLMIVMSDNLGDQFWFTTAVPQATYPTFNDIDDCDITTDNNSVDGYFNAAHFLRFMADDLVDRAENRINFSGNEDLKKEALFWGYFVGGLSRYYLAVHFGIDPTTPGNVIDKSPFIPEADLLAQAREKLQEALTNAPDAYYTRLTYTMIAKTYLAQNNYAQAYNAAINGLVEGDPAFEIPYTDDDDNYVWQQAGALRTQLVVDPRFVAYLTADPAEAARIQLEPIAGNDGNTYYRQIKYPLASSPIPLLTWQENNLILAECALNGQDGNALDLINQVRLSHGLSALAGPADMTMLITERDKELFLTGNRVVDMRRLGIPFNNPRLGTNVGPWRVLPITDNERNGNPNLND